MCKFLLIITYFTRFFWLLHLSYSCLLSFVFCSYVLGAVFLQLCKVLRLEEHKIVQKPVDPSLFIIKYTISKYLFVSYLFERFYRVYMIYSLLQLCLWPLISSILQENINIFISDVYVHKI